MSKACSLGAANENIEKNDHICNVVELFYPYGGTRVSP
jgi:hypothetical protein